MATSGAFEAVFFFDKNGIVKEMLNQEFESILDGLMGMSDLAGKNVQAAYADIDSDLNLTAIVFFTIIFDKQGMADTSWNLPLARLAKKGVDGPDMGAGSVRIFMQSTNELPACAKYLWDPVERGGKNDLFHVRDAVRNNRLCLSSDTEEDSSGWMGDASMVMREPDSSVPVVPDVVPEIIPEVKPASKPTAKPVVSVPVTTEFEEVDIPVATSTLASADNDEFSQAMKIIESQRIKMTALENALLNEKSKGNADLQKKLKNGLMQAEKALEQSLVDEEQFKERITELEKALKEDLKTIAQLEKSTEQVSKKADKDSQSANEKLEKLKEKYEKSIKSECDKVEKKYTQVVKKLEKEKAAQETSFDKEKASELLQERQKIESLNKELTGLRGDKFRLMKGGAEAFFKKLDDADISFMSFKPGAGHITITLEDIGSFIEEPDIYLANKCGVSIEEYNDWLAHYENPVCEAPLPDNEVCGKKVFRTDAPSKFKAGSSDRCKSHGGK